MMAQAVTHGDRADWVRRGRGIGVFGVRGAGKQAAGETAADQNNPFKFVGLRETAAWGIIM